MGQDLELVKNMSDIGGGVIEDGFIREFNAVLKNIQDENTGVGARTINVKVIFKPDEKRQTVSTIIETRSTLAPIKISKSTLYIDIDKDGKPEAWKREDRGEQGQFDLVGGIDLNELTAEGVKVG